MLFFSCLQGLVLQYKEFKIAMISIIMPVYNGHNYLKESVSSVINQTYGDFELICIDDSSTDDSYNILEKFAANDSRIKCYKKYNEGPGQALNYGVIRASGKYLCFIDQDDKYDETYLEKMRNAILSSGCHMAVCNAYYWTSDGVKRVPYPEYHGDLKDISTIEKKFFFKFHYFPQWTKIIERDFFISNNIKFQTRENRAHDVPVHYALMYLCDKVGYIEDCLYYHRFHKNQISYGFNMPLYYCYSLYNVMEWAKKNCNKKQQNEIKKFMIPLIKLSAKGTKDTSIQTKLMEFVFENYNFYTKFRLLYSIAKRRQELIKKCK